VFGIGGWVARMFDTGWMSGRARFYLSDTSDEQWAVIEAKVPLSWSGPDGGRPVVVPRRDVVDAIFYVVRGGCSWRQLPADFPKWSPVYQLLRQWTADGTMDAWHDALRCGVRVLEGRDPEPTAGIIDAQAVRGASTVGAGERGYDGGKRINGRKRHVVVDTLGLVLAVVVTAASVQDRDGAYEPVELAKANHPGLCWLWADRGYRGKFVEWAKKYCGVSVEIVQPRDGQKGFEVQPRRWVVERTFGWLIGHRRLAADYERRTEHAEAMCTWAMIGIMSRRLARAIPNNTVTPNNWKK
jgi:transposase